MREVLAALGNPQLEYPSVLVVGTNGKGSTAAMLEAVLLGHGVRTGLTTSPHLVAIEERIRIDGDDIAQTALDAYLLRLVDYPELTFFETMTAAAFLAFAEAGVELAILEAGMGGSWDATRVASSALAGITNVGSDHAAWLGDELADRARDKADPLRSARYAVVGRGVTPELIPVLAAPHAVASSRLVEVAARTGDRVRLAWDDQSIEVPRPLAGEHQLANLELALALARCAAEAGFAPPIRAEEVAAGLARVRWPGRLAECRLHGRSILVDGAHNLESAEALAAHLARRSSPPNLVFSCLEDKDVDAMARVLIPVVREIVVLPMTDDRAMPADRLQAAFPGASVAPDLAAALGRLPDPIVAAGSLRLVGACLRAAEEGRER